VPKKKFRYTEVYVDVTLLPDLQQHQMTTLFCHIGWMNNYQGETEDDRLRGGGSYVQEQQTGHEICNFVITDDRLYGYVQVGKERNGRYQEGEINFSRLGVSNAQDEIEDAIIVWTATDRDERRRKIVGWYRNATVHRRYQSFSSPSLVHANNNISGYWFSAPADSCVLLPTNKRSYAVPRMTPGFPGISPIWYADSPEGSHFVRETLAYITSYRGANILHTLSQPGQLVQITAAVGEDGYFESDNLTDERTRLLREVVQRRGQDRFRRQLLRAYDGRCAVTGCDAKDALEAAHIIGYLGSSTQHVKNGLLLRADIHTLFDLRLLEICPKTLNIILAPSLRRTSYAKLHGQPLSLPVATDKQPDMEALSTRWNTGSADLWAS
jgi:hypothetical protein